MGTTLVVNPGSSSKKYALYRDRERLLYMRFEHSPQGFEICSEVNGTQKKCEGITQAQFSGSLAFFIGTARSDERIKKNSEVDSVCVRVVAPGSFFQEHKIIDSEYIEALRRAESAAPLHIPPTLYEIDVLQRAFPEATLIGVSDSAFHRTLPDYVQHFSISPSDASAFDIYRYGYHGVSISSVLKQIPALVGETPEKVIVCHVGGGVSITALKDGKSVETSMGYAPGSGLVMGSRAGDLEPEALLRLIQEKNLNVFDAYRYVETEGGLYGISGQSDLRHVLERNAAGEEKAKFALSLFTHRIKLTIGAYIAALGGLDLLVFTATAVERNPNLRKIILKDLAPLDIVLDEEKNDALIDRRGLIGNGKVQVAVIPNDEMGEMLAISLSMHR